MNTAPSPALAPALEELEATAAQLDATKKLLSASIKPMTKLADQMPEVTELLARLRDLEADVKRQHKTTAGAASALAAVLGPKPARRRKSPANAPGAPEELIHLSIRERVLRAMNDAPNRSWNKRQLAKKTYVTNDNSLGAEMSRLVRDGKVVVVEAGTWALPGPTAD